MSRPDQSRPSQADQSRPQSDQSRPQADQTRPRRNAGTPTDRPSPLQNRVLPTGEVVADPSRGMLMGNRGCIHTLERRLGVTRWRSKMWISCVLRWGDTRRDVMPPGRWTALFFLDEATALAAGHRPCGFCRRPDHLGLAEAWQQARQLPERPRAAFMDVQLHAERVDRRRRQLTRPARLNALPDGVMIRHRDAISLLAGGRLLPWSFAGYGQPVRVAGGTEVEVLTPPTLVAALAHGYLPMVHPSAGRTSMRVIG
ncbi:MAG: hypothetical protein ACR2N4_06390 [Jatrophihabitans sp.]